MLGRATPLLIAIGILTSAVGAQESPVEPLPPPEMSPAALAATSAAYLTTEERKDLRVFHGIWRAGDLDTTARRARAALTQGALDDPSLLDPAADIEDRAEAALLRGEAEEAIAIIDARDSLRAIRIRAESLEAIGRRREAAQALRPLVERMQARQVTSAAELTEGVRGLMARARIQGQDLAGGGDYRLMMDLLARAREELDRLYWPARLAEAELLYEKDNYAEAQQAAAEVLSLNPSAAGAWALLGRMAVDGFDIGRSDAIAARLDRLANAVARLDRAAEEELPGSPLAKMIVARARLRQNDPDGAQAAVDGMLARFPAMRSALALRAAIAAERFLFEGADRLLEELDRLTPGSPWGYLEVGAAVSENRQYEEAARYLGEATKRGPHLARAFIELGLMELQAGRDVRARDALRRAATLDPFNVRAANSLKLVEELLRWETIESDHFVVRYRPGIDAVLAPEMLPILERIHARVAGRGPGGIDHEPAKKTLIELMPDHQWFAVRIAGMPAIHTIAASTGPVVAMESPQTGPRHSVGAYDWPRVIQHEYAHTVTLSRTSNRIPHWFTEAAAVYLEDSPRDYARCQLLANALREGALFDLEEISIKFVRPTRPTDRPQAYAQGHWMYQYIVERWGERAPLELMDRYARGERQAGAVSSVLGLSPAEFMAAFKEWAREQVVAWGLLPRAGEPSLQQLRLRAAAAEEGGRERLAAALADYAEGVAWAGAGAPAGAAVFGPALPEMSPERLHAWLEEFPAHADVLELAARAALTGGQGPPREEAVALLERYAAARPVDEMPHRHLAAIYLADPARAASAVPHLEFLDAREQHSGAYAVELARRYAAAGDWERAGLKAERATQIAPFDAGHREFAATVALRSERLEDAERHIAALVAIEPAREIHKQRLEAVRARRR